MTITIQSIKDNNSARDAQKILRAQIMRQIEGVNPRQQADALSKLMTAASNSCLVNGRHPLSKAMRSVSISQILDRMNIQALTILLNSGIGGEGSGEDMLMLLEEVFEAAKIDCSISHWPFDDYLDFGMTWTELYSRVIDETNSQSVSATESDTSVEKTYDVADDIATAANVLLRVATNGEMNDLQGLLNEVVSLRNKPAQVAAAIVPACGDIPEGTPRRVNAQVVFGLKDKLLDMEITVYDWEFDNPLVPAKDEDYIFDVSNLADALWAIESKNNAWLTGQTGTGKTTFIAALCAYTKRMMMRANMDSAIERPDFVGAMSVTTDDDGNQITQFADGFLPKAMQLPCVMLLDEYDAIRADISYVMQPVLEGGALRLMEDGGRLVHPHADFHIMATANTKGMGDSSGMYASAVKVQSRASINRFPVFIEVNYLPVESEMKLVAKFAPNLSKTASHLMTTFLTLYREGFADGTIATPISPRNTITIGKYVADFEGRLGTQESVKRALTMNVMHTIDEGDSIAVTGIMDRITA
tara:strand:+ start:706 stop:2295 length:1590 start_codon:yes stop_codon:yes gene_type:complete